MRTNSGCIFPVMVIVILVIAVASRFVVLAPIVVAIAVFLLVRKIRARMAQEAGKQQEQSQNTGTSQNTCRTGYEERVSSIITCDYCGSRVDTDMHTCCDHCGGPYGDDEEWKDILRRKRGA